MYKPPDMQNLLDNRAFRGYTPDNLIKAVTGTSTRRAPVQREGGCCEPFRNHAEVTPELRSESGMAAVGADGCSRDRAKP